MAITATTAAILTAAAAVTGAVGSISSGIAQREAAEAQAEISRQQAERARQVASQQEDDFRRRQKRLAASVRAAGGARGIDIGVGSPLLAAEDFAREVERQSLRIREGGEVRATRLEQQAGLLEAQGRAAFTSGVLGAGTSLLRGGSRSALILSE